MLNKSKGNMYTFVTHTWNTVKGKCPHGCTYCYMKRFGKQNPVRFDKSELRTDLGSGNFIFVGSSCDMWARDIPADWIHATLIHCREYSNKYLFQSKNPSRINEFGLPNDSVVCATIETNRWYPEIMQNSPRPDARAGAMAGLVDFKRYVTIEPIIDFDLEPMVQLIRTCNPERVNIGADSKNCHLPEPSMDKVIALIDELRNFTTISKKSNLGRLVK